jgi:hypothetical protein
VKPTTRSDRPHDRLTRLTAAMTDALEANPERGDEKCVIFLTSDDDGSGGLQMFGYDDDAEALADLLGHIEAIFESRGMGFRIVFADGPNLG